MYLTHIPGMIQRRMGEYLWKVNTKEQEVYLTFDDGPTPEVTPWVLDQLRNFQAKATFFMVGDQIRKYPELAHQVIDEGHEVGNHTLTHMNGKKTSLYAYLRDYAGCQQVFKEYTGKRPRLFRPPYGRISKAQAEPLLRRGINIVMMDVITGDFDRTRSPNRVAMTALKHASPGSIILFHDSWKAWPRLKEALPVVLESLANEGYRFKRLGKKV